jgi:hypothetical protein
MAPDPPPSEYDPLFEREINPAVAADEEAALRAFREASRPYLSTPVSWLSWSILLPGAALATPRVAELYREIGVAILWVVAILLGGTVEAIFLWRHRNRRRTRLAGWAMRLQGNLSLVAVSLSAVLLWADEPQLLPGLWLLLLGHSFYALGGLAFAPMRFAGVIYQLGGAIALVPGVRPLVVFAVATALGNLWIGIGVWRRRGDEG